MASVARLMARLALAIGAACRRAQPRSLHLGRRGRGEIASGHFCASKGAWAYDVQPAAAPVRLWMLGGVSFVDLSPRGWHGTKDGSGHELDHAVDQPPQWFTCCSGAHHWPGYTGSPPPPCEGGGPCQ